MRKLAKRPGLTLSLTMWSASGMLMLLIVAACAWPSAGAAQSGRRQPPPISPVATPTPAPDQSEQGESESIPRGEEKKRDAGFVASFVIFEGDESFVWLDSRMRQDVTEAFMQRLGQSKAVSVSNAGRGARKQARDRAKTEGEAFVVLFQLEDQSLGASGSMGRADERSLVIRTFVFAPRTGDIKYQDTTYQRPYNESATIGGVRIPVPSRRIERYPSELQLRQAAQEAADRLMSRFGIILPPNR